MKAPFTAPITEKREGRWIQPVEPKPEQDLYLSCDILTEIRQNLSHLGACRLSRRIKTFAGLPGKKPCADCPADGLLRPIRCRRGIHKGSKLCGCAIGQTICLRIALQDCCQLLSGDRVIGAELSVAVAANVTLLCRPACRVREPIAGNDVREICRTAASAACNVV